MIRLLSVFILASAVGALGGSAAWAQNLVVNGGFDSGFSGWLGTYGLYSAAINPAPLSGTTVGLSDGGQNPLYQSFSTVPGTTYELDWGMRLPDLGPNGYPVVGESTIGPAVLKISLNGQFYQYLLQDRTVWDFGTLDFVATGTSAQLSFSVPQYIVVGGNLQRSESVFLDNVSVIAVPEPSICGVLVVGMAFLVQRKGAFQHLFRSRSPILKEQVR